MTINEIMDSIKSNETLIIPIVKDDILLSLTCNLSDTRTYSYAQHYFPDFTIVTFQSTHCYAIKLKPLISMSVLKNLWA
ncbi:hypothetical protein IANJMKHF_00427 [Klebsiella phage CPRSA]|nr:hypothetical protein IANJMKHF_00427 [Klebsiella phage CPRSA]